MLDTPRAEIRIYFVRDRNALVARGDLSALYVDFYLHLADYSLEIAEPDASILKDALAAITLHCASRPRSERIAWTVSFQSPPRNIFVTGDNPAGTIVGTVFTDGVKETDTNLFYADTVRAEPDARRSVVDFDGSDFFRAAERYYEASEQRLARYFRLAGDDFVLVSAQPDCDAVWIEDLDDSEVRTLDSRYELSLLEQRFYRFHCGCSHDRMLELLAPGFRDDSDALFGDSEVIRLLCPRCSARHSVTREALEAFLADSTRSST